MSPSYPPSNENERRLITKYVRPPYCRAEIYAGRVTCCRRHGEHADCWQGRQTNGQTDERFALARPA